MMGSVDELQNAEEAVAQLREQRQEQEREQESAERQRDPVRATARLERHFQAIALDQIATMTNMRSAALPAIQDLALSIRENGLLQPPSVRAIDDAEQPYQLIFGRRRFEALKLLDADGLLDEPVEFEVIAGLSTIEAMTMMAVENLQREDPEPLQFARMLRMILREDPELTAADVARSWGINPNKARSFLRLLELPDSIQQRLETGDLSFTTADLLRRAVDTGRIDSDQAETLATQAGEGQLSGDELRREAGYVPPPPPGYDEWADADDVRQRQARRDKTERVSEEAWEDLGDDDPATDSAQRDGLAEVRVGGGALAIPIPPRPPAAIAAARQARIDAMTARGEFRETTEGLEALDEEATDDQLDAYLLGWLLSEQAPEAYLQAFAIEPENIWQWVADLEPDERLRRLRDLSLILLSAEATPPAAIFAPER